MPIPELAILLVLTKEEANYLEDMLDRDSHNLSAKRKRGAKPGKQENFVNQLREEVTTGITNARPIDRV
jgi:hypothetical protein